MPINGHEILEVCQQLASDRNMRVTVTQSAKGGLMAGAGAFVGGICMGPLGLAIGATVGGLIAYANAEEFKPAAMAIMTMPEHEKARLIESVQRIIADLDISDATRLLLLLNGNQILTATIVDEIVGVLKQHCVMVTMD